jgi:hypothetical protein
MRPTILAIAAVPLEVALETESSTFTISQEDVCDSVPLHHAQLSRDPMSAIQSQFRGSCALEIAVRSGAKLGS